MKEFRSRLRNNLPSPIFQKAESQKTLDASDAEDLKKSEHVYTNPAAEKTMDWPMHQQLPPIIFYESVV